MGDKRTPELEDLTAGTDGNPSVAWWRSIAITSVGFAVALGLLVLIWLLVRPLTLVLIAIIIAQALMPVVAFLERWVPRAIAVVAIYLVLIGGVGGLIWLILPSLLDQAQMLANNAPEMLTRLRDFMDDFDAEATEQVFGAAESLASRFGDTLIGLPLTVFSGTIEFILVIFMSAYWLIAAPSLRSFTLSLFPEERRDRASGVMDAMGQTMGGYVRGEVIDAIVVGTVAFIGMSIIGLEFTLILAIIVGFGELLPVIGPIITAIPPILVGLSDSLEQGIIVAVFFLVLQQLESNVILPLVMRNQADVPPLLSLISISAGSALGGLLGAIIAIPLVSALRIMVVRVLAPAEREWTGVDDAPTEVGVAPDGDDGG